MAASGALEIVAAIELMNRSCIPPTLNLENADPACAGIRHATETVYEETACILKNNFAFGGVNSSIVLRRAEHE
jgi:3-oxoacyl-[acyl-carrier-protein] synthase II